MPGSAPACAGALLATSSNNSSSLCVFLWEIGNDTIPVLISSHSPEAISAVMNLFIFYSLLVVGMTEQQAFPSQLYCILMFTGLRR